MTLFLSNEQEARKLCRQLVTLGVDFTCETMQHGWLFTHGA